MSKVNEGFSPEQAKQAARLFPGLVHHIEPGGQVVLSVTKEELLTLQAKYPSAFADDVRFAPSGSAELDALAARYPSMFRK